MENIDKENLDRYYRKITESIKLLCLPFEEQKQCFPKFVDVPFEVLDTFDHAFLLVPQLIDDGRFSDKAISAIIRLYNLINSTSANPSLKDLEDEQFSTAEDWNKVREYAKETLIIMGKPVEYPDLKYI